MGIGDEKDLLAQSEARCERLRKRWVWTFGAAMALVTAAGAAGICWWLS